MHTQPQFLLEDVPPSTIGVEIFFPFLLFLIYFPAQFDISVLDHLLRVMFNAVMIHG